MWECKESELRPCKACVDRPPLGIDFSMAFQPIVDVETYSIFAYEALVRGLKGESAAQILDQIDLENRYQFDQACRVKAVGLASGLGITSHVSINFLPNAVYEPATCIRATLEAARRFNYPLERLIFEITENERVVDHQHLKRIIQEYRRHGFKTAIDDFGAGYSGLNLLADLQPDIIKLDMALVREIDTDRTRQAVVVGLVSMCRALGIMVIAEGVETVAEYQQLRNLGITHFQGYLFARPSFERLPQVEWPE